MPLLRGEIDSVHGPLIAVCLQVDRQVASAWRASGRDVPDAVRGYALIDTGASRSGVDEGLAVSLHLHPCGVAELHTPAGPPMKMGVFFGELLVHRDLPPLRQQFLGMNLAYPVLDGQLVAILGRDFLSGSSLQYDGLNQTFCVDWQPGGRPEAGSLPTFPTQW